MQFGYKRIIYNKRRHNYIVNIMAQTLDSYMKYVAFVTEDKKP